MGKYILLGGAVLSNDAWFEISKIDCRRCLVTINRLVFEKPDNQLHVFDKNGGKLIKENYSGYFLESGLIATFEVENNSSGLIIRAGYGNLISGEILVYEINLDQGCGQC